jgi:hypothetical protein
MNILIETATGNEVNRWLHSPGKVEIPGTNDVVFPGDDTRPMAIGPDHFLATATVVDDPIDDSQKHGPEVVSVVDQEVTITRTAIDKDADELILEWEASRRNDYGDIGEQLDMQYWDGVNDTTVWSDHIAKVKADHPNPEVSD